MNVSRREHSADAQTEALERTIGLDSSKTFNIMKIKPAKRGGHAPSGATEGQSKHTAQACPDVSQGR